MDGAPQFLSFASLRAVPGLRHAVTTRGGGCSEAEYSALNLAYHVGDDAARVTRNRRLLAAALGYDADRLVAAQQTHGAQSQIVSGDRAGRGATDGESALPATDALLTREPQLPLLILVADCAPLLLVDEKRRVLAVVHAGWRGAVAGIAAQTVARMRAEFGSDAAGIRAGIGPSLCAACFEVGAEVADAARPLAADAVLAGNSRPHLDLRRLLQRDLEAAGVLPPHIAARPECPRCCPELLFSHRGQRGVAGRFGLVAWWE
jgi:YfiH family protein